jgi:hypothetical protein
MPSSTWVCPPGVTSVYVEAWGCGSNGTLNSQGTGGGGGGGAYGRTVAIPVTPGHSYSIGWGDGGTGVSTSFTDDLLGHSLGVVGVFSSSSGADGILNNVGATGASHNGGNGTPAVAIPPAAQGDKGGGGGSVAGRSGNGNNATGQTGGTGPDGGGTGGNGGASAAGNFLAPGPGTPGQGPGGGGGGPGWSFLGPETSGLGGDGGINFWDATGGGSFATVILVPVNRVGTYGSVPPLPVNPKKKVKRAFVM